MLGIPSSLVLSVKNRGVEGGGGLANGQNLLSVTKVVNDPVRKKLLGHYLKSKTNNNFQVLLGHHEQLVFFVVVCVFFPIQQ